MIFITSTHTRAYTRIHVHTHPCVDTHIHTNTRTHMPQEEASVGIREEHVRRSPPSPCASRDCLPKSRQSGLASSEPGCAARTSENRKGNPHVPSV